MLATHSLFPIVKAFSSKAGVDLEIKDISLSARILSIFADYLEQDQRVDNSLLELGELVNRPEANIIKLPNISASIPQLVATVEELQSKGFMIPSYPQSPITDKEKEIQMRYNSVKGSAVNPVLREGNSDRRAPKAVKNYAKINPHSMGNWNSDSKTHIATMQDGDFFHNEKSVCIEKATLVRIELQKNDGSISVLKKSIPLLTKEIIDSSLMSKKSLLTFLESEMKDAKESGILLSFHMKATMMKVSDPIIFSHVVNVFFKDLILKHQVTFNSLGVDLKNGFGDLVSKIKDLSFQKKQEIENDIELAFENNANIAMVDSDNGITNLHVPSDVIIDASMPAMIRNSGKMWNRNNETEDTKAVIPDSSYASIYSATIDFCKENGAFDPKTMGTVPNVGLMAQKAEEYGSHDKTYEMFTSGVIRVIDSDENILTEHTVAKGDIWRMCQTKDEPIRNWVKLAVNRAKSTNWPTVFWLDENRSHDAEIILKVNEYLKHHDISGLDLKILSPYDACKFTLERVRNGENIISVTGNVLRDYLTDLFPILELGTSAKMLSIVPLMNGGGLFETGAGGSAPKHVQQFFSEGHLRWDSLGEFLAIAASLEHFSEVHINSKAKVLADSLNIAIERILKNRKSPSRNVGQMDNRGSHYYLAKYWSEELANQEEDQELSDIFAIVSTNFQQNEKKIVDEINRFQGTQVIANGYYFLDTETICSYMRPSQTLNKIIDSL
jgi:isocitrate dehydrogenase